MQRLLSRLRLMSKRLLYNESRSSRTITSNMNSFPDSILSDEMISLPSDLSLEDLRRFPAYKTWRSALAKTLQSQSSPEHPFHSNPYKLRGINVQAVDRFKGGRLGFIKLQVDIRTDDGQTLPGSIFMRGGSVAMLLVLRPEDAKSDDDEYLILTTQPRIPAGTFSFTEIPAGMLDDSGTFSGAAAKEIQEETGLTIREDELVDITELTLSVSSEMERGEVLQNAIYPSPGGSDEFIPLFLARKTMPMKEIKELQGKLTGLRDHGEKITLRICKTRDAWQIAGRDAKTLSALCLYDGLRREGKV